MVRQDTMNIMESLQKTQTKRAEQPVPGQAANLRKMLGAKSGKAGATSGPAASSVQENQALADFNAAATTQQQANQVNVGNQQLAEQGQQQQTAQAFDNIQQRDAESQQKFNQAITEIDNKLNRLGDDIESKEARATLNEAIFARRLADDKYLAELRRQGVTRRLDNSNQFQLEAGKQAFDNWEKLFKDEEEFSTALSMDEADFRKGLARMGIDQAREILKSNAEAANRQATYSAGADFINTAVGAGMKAYGNLPSSGAQSTALTTPAEDAANMSLNSSQRGTFVDSTTNSTSKNWWEN